MELKAIFMATSFNSQVFMMLYKSLWNAFRRDNLLAKKYKAVIKVLRPKLILILLFY